MDLIDIYRTFHSKKAKYTFFSNAHGTFSKIDYTVGYITSLNKYNKTVVILSIILDNNGLKLETKLKGKTQKHSNSCRLNNILLNNEWFNNSSKEEIK